MHLLILLVDFLAKDIFIQPFIMTFATYRACIEFFKLKDTKSILSLCIGKIKLGDLIYDQVLRSTKKGTILSLNINVFLAMVRSYYYYYQYSYFGIKNFHTILQLIQLIQNMEF